MLHAYIFIESSPEDKCFLSLCKLEEPRSSKEEQEEMQHSQEPHVVPDFHLWICNPLSPHPPLKRRPFYPRFYSRTWVFPRKIFWEKPPKMVKFQIQWGQEPYEDETFLTRTFTLCLSTIKQLTVLWFLNHLLCSSSFDFSWNNYCIILLSVSEGLRLRYDKKKIKFSYSSSIATKWPYCWPRCLFGSEAG